MLKAMYIVVAKEKAAHKLPTPNQTVWHSRNVWWRLVCRIDPLDDSIARS